jgi:hypothetical protein
MFTIFSIRRFLLFNLLSTVIATIIITAFANYYIDCQAINEGLDDEMSDLVALIMSVATVGMSISIGSWTPVEVGMCLGAAIFYLHIWVQTGGTFSLPSRRKKVVSSKDATYLLTDLGKPIGEMSQEERRVAAKKVVQTMLDQVKKQEKD